jgi:hypothetical protein
MGRRDSIASTSTGAAALEPHAPIAARTEERVKTLRQRESATSGLV